MFKVSTYKFVIQLSAKLWFLIKFLCLAEIQYTIKCQNVLFKEIISHEKNGEGKF